MTITPSTQSPTRRQRLREGMVEEIKAVARRQLVDHGPGGVSLRAIAREMGTASSALFRYFPSYNDLINALIIDAYDSLADVVVPAPDTRPTDDHTGRWFALCQAYRRWSLDHRSEFTLINGTPLPGYEALPEVTGPSAGRLPIAGVGLYDAAVAAGAADPNRSEVPPDLEIGPLWQSLIGDRASTTEARRIAIVLSAWCSMQGYLQSEIFGSLTRLISDTGTLYSAHIRTTMLGMGFQPELVVAAH